MLFFVAEMNIYPAYSSLDYDSEDEDDSYLPNPNAADFDIAIASVSTCTWCGREFGSKKKLH